MKNTILISMAAVCVCIAILMDGVARTLFFTAAAIWAVTALITTLKRRRNE